MVDPLPEAAAALPFAALQRWKGLVGPAMSLAIVVAVLIQLRHIDWRLVREAVPSSPVIWIVLAAGYFASPTGDWLIFRRLWHIPLSGFIPLVKKMIGNEILIGYFGEAYFYDWARRNVTMAGSPFGAVKDVAILSALAGNALTVAMLAAAWPLLGTVNLGADGKLMLGSLGVVLLTSLFIMALRNRLLSLPRNDLIYAFSIHCARIMTGSALLGLAWHLILPTVGLGLWLLLATIRLLISRLPLIPNKDLVFAGIAAMLVGRTTEVTAVLAMIATLTLAAHVVFGAVLVSFDFVRRRRQE